MCLHSLPNTGPVTLGCAGTGGQAEHRSASYPHQSSHTEHLAQAEGGDEGRCAPSALPSPGPPQHHSTGAISRRAAPPSAERARRWLPPGTGAGGGGAALRPPGAPREALGTPREGLGTPGIASPSCRRCYEPLGVGNGTEGMRHGRRRAPGGARAVG